MMWKLMRDIVVTFIALPLAGLGGVFFAYETVNRQPAAPLTDNSHTASRYADCVFESIRAQQATDEAVDEADRENFVHLLSGMPWSRAMQLIQMMPRRSAVDIATERRETLMRIKEFCRLNFPLHKQ
jgi:hypothetical protein